MHIETAHLHINEAKNNLDAAMRHIGAIVVDSGGHQVTDGIRNDWAHLNGILTHVASLVDAWQHDIAALMFDPD